MILSTVATKRFLAACLISLLPAPALAQDSATLVTMCYVGLLHRAPDPGGLAYWTEAMQNGTTLAQVIQAFVSSAEYSGAAQAYWTATFTGTPSDVADVQLTRNAYYAGGSVGWVNGTVRIVDNIGPYATAFEWADTAIINSAAAAGQNVARYNQANGSSSGPVWAGVDQCTQIGTGNCVAREIDIKKPTGSPGLAIGLDVVNYGNADAGIRVSPGIPAVVSAVDPTSYIEFCPGGGLEIVNSGTAATACH